MTKLVRVCRTEELSASMPSNRRSGEVRVINPREVKDEVYSSFAYQGEFFLFEQEGPELEVAIEWLANNNPGKDIEVWNLESVALCPAGPLVRKQVTKDGILPL